MKLFLLLVLAPILLVCLYFGFLSYTAKPIKPGLVDGKLRSCPNKPNCVNSEAQDDKAIEPILLPSGNVDEVWEKINRAIEATGGEVKLRQGDYLWAEYKSKLFRFVDDLELRLDQQEMQLHVRSASRSGTSDLGINRKRVEALRSALR